jgi:hypothetical protein
MAVCIHCRCSLSVQTAGGSTTLLSNNIYLKHAFRLWCTVDYDRLDLLHCKAPSCVCCALRNKWRTVNAPAASSWKLHSCIIRKSHGRHVALDSPLSSRSFYAEQLNGLPLPGGFECNDVSIVTPRSDFPPCCGRASVYGHLVRLSRCLSGVAQPDGCCHLLINAKHTLVLMLCYRTAKCNWCQSAFTRTERRNQIHNSLHHMAGCKSPPWSVLAAGTERLWAKLQTL